MSRTGRFLTVLACLPFAGCGPHYNVTASDVQLCSDLILTSSHRVDGCTASAVEMGGDRVRTVLAPEAEARPISLAECIALALENGRLGTTNIRVYALDPAIAGADIEQALSRFDARWQSSAIWNVVDQRTGTAQQAILGGEGFIRQDLAHIGTSLLKPLPTGGVAGITFRTDYELARDLNSTVNPAYTPFLVFGFEQPLLQGAGVEINQLRRSHPVTGVGDGPGILLSRTAYDLSRIDLQARVQELLFNVEEAYWNLYASYWNLYSRDTGLRQSYAAWYIGKLRYEKGELSRVDLAKIEQQFQVFRGERLQALGNATGGAGVLEAERVLRFTIGLPPEDGQRLVPLDRPTATPVEPNWPAARDEALANRPDLLRSRQDLKLARLTLERERDLLRPDLRVFGNYDFNGLGNRLDGADGNAFRSLASNRFHDWTFGLRLDVPVGFRNAHALVRKAELQLEQRLIALRDQEVQAVFDLQHSYRQLVQLAESIHIARARKKAAAVQIDGLSAQFLAGQATIDFLITAQRLYVDALRDEYLGLALYNTALADFERQQGTLPNYDNVHIAEAALPSSAQARASNRIRERQAALLLRERALPALPSARESSPSLTPPPVNEEEARWLADVLDGRGEVPQLPTNPATPPTAPMQGGRPGGPSK